LLANRVLKRCATIPFSLVGSLSYSRYSLIKDDYANLQTETSHDLSHLSIISDLQIIEIFVCLITILTISFATLRVCLSSSFCGSYL
jgi:hypothetical protein